MFSTETFTGSAGVNTYTFTTLRYLSADHLTVTVNGVDTAFTSNAARTAITISGTFVGGEAIVVTRSTPSTEAGRLVDFQDLSHVRQSDLDTSSLQLLYIIQEAMDFVVAATCLGLGVSGHWDAESLRITNVADGVASTDLVNKGQLDAIVVSAGSLPAVSSADNDKSLWVVAGAWAIRTPTQARAHLGLGTAALLTAGTGASQAVQFDGSARYPSNDGRNIDLSNHSLLNLRYRTTVSQFRNTSLQTPPTDATATWSESAGSRLTPGTQTSLDNSSDVVLSGTKITLSAGTWEVVWNMRAYNQNATAGNDQDLRVKVTNDTDGPTQVVYDSDYDKVDIESGGTGVLVHWTLSNTLLLKLAAGGDVVFRAANEDGSDIRIASLTAVFRKVSTST